MSMAMKMVPIVSRMKPDLPTCVYYSMWRDTSADELKGKGCRGEFLPHDEHDIKINDSQRTMSEWIQPSVWARLQVPLAGSMYDQGQMSRTKP